MKDKRRFERPIIPDSFSSLIFFLLVIMEVFLSMPFRVNIVDNSISRCYVVLLLTREVELFKVPCLLSANQFEARILVVIAS